MIIRLRLSLKSPVTAWKRFGNPLSCYVILERESLDGCQEVIAESPYLRSDKRRGGNEERLQGV